MWWIFAVLVVMVLAVSLYDFFVAREWHEVTYSEDASLSPALKERHRRANDIRKTYNRVMLLIVAGLLAFAVSAIYVNETFGSGMNAVLPRPKFDTIQMSLEAPPLQPIETLPESYKLEGNSSRNSHAQEAQKAEEGKVQPTDPDNPADPSSNPDKSKPDKTTVTPPVTQPKSKKNPNLNASDQAWVEQAERQQEELHERTRQRAFKREQTRLLEEQKRQNGNKPTKIEQPTSKSGTADVDWNHSWRKAFQNNDDNLRSPKYMCQPGVSGKVIIKVKVNSNGNVISAVSLTSGVDQCLIETAIAYAYKSRFEPSSKASDEGNVTYTYYP